MNFLHNLLSFLHANKRLLFNSECTLRLPPFVSPSGFSSPSTAVLQPNRRWRYDTRLIKGRPRPDLHILNRYIPNAGINYVPVGSLRIYVCGFAWWFPPYLGCHSTHST